MFALTGNNHRLTSSPNRVLAGPVSQLGTQTASAFVIPSNAQATGELPHPTGTAEAVEPVDFHHLSSRQLMQWINSEISSGRMSLDESSRYVGLTINGMPVADNSTGDSWRDVKRDYFRILDRGIEGAMDRGDAREARKLTDMITRLSWAQYHSTASPPALTAPLPDLGLAGTKIIRLSPFLRPGRSLR